MNKKTLRLYCFSPPVMLATFSIEIIFALYVVLRYKMTLATRLIVALLVLLAFFQGTEFLLCGGFGVPGGIWSKIGYVSITLLPPLGIHLLHAIAGKKSKTLIYLSYLTAVAFVIYFAFVTQAISGHTCYANYVTFDMKSAAAWLYGAYYYGWLFAGAFLAAKWAKNERPRIKVALYSLMAGYLALLIPTTTFNLIDQNSTGGIPSIMCGFAVILAFLLTVKVIPNATEKRRHAALKSDT